MTVVLHEITIYYSHDVGAIILRMSYTPAGARYTALENVGKRGDPTGAHWDSPCLHARVFAINTLLPLTFPSRPGMIGFLLAMQIFRPPADIVPATSESGEVASGRDISVTDKK